MSSLEKPSSSKTLSLFSPRSGAMDRILPGVFSNFGTMPGTYVASQDQQYQLQQLVKPLSFLQLLQQIENHDLSRVQPISIFPHHHSILVYKYT